MHHTNFSNKSISYLLLVTHNLFILTEQQTILYDSFLSVFDQKCLLFTRILACLTANK